MDKLYKTILISTFFLITSCEKNSMKLYINCNVYGRPDIKSILCNDGKILQLLPSTNINSGKKIDLKGGWVYPGFIDSHMHLTGLGFSLESIDLVGTNSKSDVLDIIKNNIKDYPKGSWIFGRGWDQNDWEDSSYPTAKDLDQLSNEHPMVFRRIDGHAIWTNTLAMKISNINSKTKNIDGGIIIRDNKSIPTGLFIDNAIDLIEDNMPEKSDADIRRHILKAQSLLNRYGITSVHDAGTSKNEIDVIKNMIKNKELTIRIFSMINNNPKDYDSFLKNGPEIDNPFLRIESIKIYLDGALGSRGAALLEPYTDSPNQKGLLLISSYEHRQLVKKFNMANFQVNTHGIGDRAIRLILDNYEEAANLSMRNRIEHSQIVDDDDIPRFKKLNVTPAIQATHCTSDMYWVEDRLGKDRIHKAYPWKSFINLGIPLPGGSDAPIENPDPLEGIYASITRQDKMGYPEKGWEPDQKMSLPEAIKSYTEWASYASNEENIKGKIEEGFYADFTVLDKELKSENPKMILNTRVLATILNGEIIYEINND
jgi:predicted amidohydrolase YtcJ